MSKNLCHNLSLAMYRKGTSQAELARGLSSEGVTRDRAIVNKWVKGTMQPDEATILKISAILDIRPEDLASLNPIKFGERYGLTRNELERALGEDNDTIFLNSRNFVNEKDDHQLSQIVGVYLAIMPSWVYRGFFNKRFLEIYFLRDAYYFRDSHLAFRQIPAACYAGSVGRVGSNIHLIGEETEGSNSSLNKPNELIFTTLQPTDVERQFCLRGLALGSDPLSVSAVPVASPYFAVRLRTDVDPSKLGSEYAETGYSHEGDVNLPGIRNSIEQLQNIKQSWMTSKAVWEDN